MYLERTEIAPYQLPKDCPYSNSEITLLSKKNNKQDVLVRFLISKNKLDTESFIVISEKQRLSANFTYFQNFFGDSRKAPRNFI